MQETKKKTESILLVGIKLAASVAFALVLLFLLTMPGTGIAMLLGDVSHETVYSWLKYPLLLATGFAMGRMFASFCNLKGVLCGTLTSAFFLLALVLLRALMGIQTGDLWGAGIALFCSSVLGSVVSACKRS